MVRPQGLDALRAQFSSPSGMSGIDRRKFLKKTAAGVASVSAIADWPLSAAAKNPPASASQAAIPPHRAIEIPGLHAYAERSVAAGETVHFRVSSTAPCELSVCRLGLEVDEFESDETLYSFTKSEPGLQPIHPGSYVHVEHGLPPDRVFDAITLECWVRPWSWEEDQGLITAFDATGDCGFALMVAQGGWIKLYLGDGGPIRGGLLRAYRRLNQREWHHLAMTWDGAAIALYVDGGFQTSWAYNGPVTPGRTPLRLAAAGSEGRASYFLDGDLAMPAIYARALSDQEVKARFDARGLELPTGPGVVACWPLDEEQGGVVQDASGNGRHGRIINRATWMIGGPSFDAEAIPRHSDYDPTQDATRGHALRFASDDLYDCRWGVTHAYEIPKDAKSGIYVGRFHFEDDGEPRKYHVTFIVRKAVDRPKAPILMLCSTNTWQAYSATPFAKNRPDRQFWEIYGFPNTVEGSPSYCCYRNHHRGQPTYAVGMKMPWPCAGSDVLFSEPEVNYSHLMRGERFAHNWLTEAGYDYDVVTDHDLHRDPTMLDGYKVLIINGHSEYWSIEAYEGIDRFLRSGGNAIGMTGNTMFWRVSFDEDGGAMECRKFGVDIGGREDGTVGETFHSHDKKRGSLMRYAGYPAWQLLGLECIGWWPLHTDQFGSYEVTDAGHFLFHQPEKVEIRNGERFGHAPDGRLPRGGRARVGRATRAHSQDHQARAGRRVHAGRAAGHRDTGPNCRRNAAGHRLLRPLGTGSIMACTPR